MQQCLISLSLCVYVSPTVRPKISEEEVASEYVQPYMFGMQHQLTCTAFGVPMPNITWLWQPCHPDPTDKE